MGPLSSGKAARPAVRQGAGRPVQRPSGRLGQAQHRRRVGVAVHLAHAEVRLVGVQGAQLSASEVRRVIGDDDAVVVPGGPAGQRRQRHRLAWARCPTPSPACRARPRCPGALPGRCRRVGGPLPISRTFRSSVGGAPAEAGPAAPIATATPVPASTAAKPASHLFKLRLRCLCLPRLTDIPPKPHDFGGREAAAK